MNTIAFLLCLLVVIVFYIIFIWIIVGKIESKFNEKLNSIRYDIHNNHTNIESKVESVKKTIDFLFSRVYQIEYPPLYKIGKLTENIIITQVKFNDLNDIQQYIIKAPGYYEYKLFLINTNEELIKTESEVKKLLKEESEKK